MIDMSRRVKKCSAFLMSISTKEHPDLDRYKKSAEAHGFKPNILGLHEKKTTGHSTGDFSFKLKYLLEFCKKRKPNDIIIQTDAWDVIAVNDCDNIVKLYKSFNKDIVVGGEKFCWPDILKFYRFNILTAHFPYLNSGLIIGKAGVIKDIVEKYSGNGPIDDQRMWITAYFENRSKIAIDENAKIFLNVLYTHKEDIVYEDNKLKYKPTNTYPIFVHAQGPDKSYLNYIRY